MADRTVNVNINYKVNTKDVKSAEAQVGKASQATEKLRKSTLGFGADAKKAGSQASQAFASVQKDVKSLSDGFSSLKGTVQTVIAALAVREIANLSLEMAKLSGNVEGVKRAFDKLPNSVKLMQDLKEATSNTVSELQLMQTAIKARNFNIPLERLSTLLAFATVKAQQTGESVDYLVDSIVTGIGRESPLILDNLQLRMADIKKVMQETGVALGEAVGIIAQRQLEEMGGLAETGAVKAERLSAAWKNFYAVVAKSYYSLGVDKVLDKLTKLLGGDDLDVIKNSGIDKAFIQQFTGLNVAVTNESRILVANIQKTVEDLNKTFDVFDFKGEDFDKNFNEVVRAFETVIPSSKGAREAALNYVKALTDVQKASVATGATSRALLDEQNRAAIAHQFQKDFEKQHENQIYALTVAQELEAQAVKESKKAIDELTKSYKVLVEFMPQLVQEVEALPEVFSDIFPGEDKIRERLNDPFKKAIHDIGVEFEKAKIELLTGSIGIAENLANSLIDSEANSYNIRIQNLQSYYDEQELLAGDNERTKAELRLKEQRQIDDLRREQAVKEKKSARLHILINTAASIAKTAANLGFPAAFPFIALAIANGAAQLAALNKAQVQGFAKGKIGIQGPGSGTSDSIPAMLSRGESVITSEATSRSKKILGLVNARKIDDKLLQNIQLSAGGVKYVGMDPKPIVEAIRANAVPDLIRQNNLIYLARRSGENYTRYIRSKSINTKK